MQLFGITETIYIADYIFMHLTVYTTRSNVLQLFIIVKRIIWLYYCNESVIKI